MTENELVRILKANPDLSTAEPWFRVAIPAIEATITCERDLQAAVIEECDRRAQYNPLYSMVAAIPNGMVRRGARVDAGVRAGLPDLVVLLPRRGYHAAFIELKFGKNRLHEMQRRWIERLKAEGYCATVIWDSVEEVMDFLTYYIE